MSTPTPAREPIREAKPDPYWNPDASPEERERQKMAVTPAREPMTEERLAYLRQRAEQRVRLEGIYDLHDAMQEVDRLQALVAAQRKTIATLSGSASPVMEEGYKP